jgi:hypothetical protein
MAASISSLAGLPAVEMPGAPERLAALEESPLPASCQPVSMRSLIEQCSPWQSRTLSVAVAVAAQLAELAAAVQASPRLAPK